MGFKFHKRDCPVTWHDAPVLHLYTDGSAHPNPNYDGRGGWGFILCEPGLEHEPVEGASGRCPGPVTTNQRSELRAAFYGLNHVNELVVNGTWTGREVVVMTDSQYVITVARSFASPRANPDLVQRLRGACRLLEAAGIRVRFRHVEAHAGIPGNEQADKLAGLWREDPCSRG